MDLKAENPDSPDNENFAPEYRDRLRTWLVKMINSGKIPGLFWENEERTIFRMPWKHAGRQDYNLEEDSKIFMAWAKHSGRYREGIDKPEPIVWKTRLRCALNKMPDIRELPDRSRLDISEPYRVYQLLPPVHKASQIRRRLYKRSQSHDTDHVRLYSDQSQPLTVLNSPDHDSEAWSKMDSSPRRSASMETAQFSLPARTSPLSSTAQAFWYSPAVSGQLKTSLSGLALPQAAPIAVDAVNPLWKQLAHSQYPLVPSLHAPFVPFNTASLPSIFPNTQASLNAFKHLALAPSSTVASQVKQLTEQAIAAERNYQNRLSNLTRKHEDESKSISTEEKLRCHRLSSTEDISSQDFENLRKKSTELLNKERDDDATIKNMQAMIGNNRNGYNPEVHPLYIQLAELQKRIEGLEKDLDASRTAHAREREARKSLEIECHKARLLLQHREQLRPLGLFIQPQDNHSLKETFNRNLEHNKVEHKHDVSQILKKQEDSKIEYLSPNDTRFEKMWRNHQAPKSAFVEVRRSSNPSSDDASAKRGYESQRKRSSLPLDLTVPSPPKLRRMSEEEVSDVTPGVSKPSPSPFCENPSFVTSSSSVASCDDKRSNVSPLSASSESSGLTSVGPSSASSFRSRSLSPLQRSNILQTQRSIKVT